MTSAFQARVVCVRSREFAVQVEGERDRILVTVPKKLRFQNPGFVDPVAVGDMVRVADGVVEGVEPRRNAITRPASGRGGKRQVLAANVDLALIMQAAASPVWKPATFDRYLVMASVCGVPAAVCINKIDLDPLAAADPVFAEYTRLGILALPFSARTGEGMEAIEAALRGRISVLLGPSGVGKSSVVNRLLPVDAARVGEVSERTGKGTHTTTWVDSLDVPGGGRIIDSPGLRVLDLTGVRPADLALHFPEFGEAAACRFPDCAHLAEPGCGVKAAAEAGVVAAGRYDSYCRIHDSLIRGRG